MPRQKNLSLLISIALAVFAVCSISLSGCSNHHAGADSAEKVEEPADNAVVNATDANFEQEVLKAEGVVLVDFWAPWCGPCRHMSPIVHEVAVELKDKIKVVKVNTDECPATAQTYQITGIPSLFVFKDGHVIDKNVGAIPKEKLLEIVNKHLN